MAGTCGGEGNVVRHLRASSPKIKQMVKALTWRVLVAEKAMPCSITELHPMHRKVEVTGY